ncbi:hemolysin III family protein [Mesobacillus maritimus]|uniref:PAQR family membrane homeostasis protein TrhA n=1 Tax=Mesobacillus maritimus TaxID=1643336 RepID=UPI00203E00FD|nr:hemolysin III family protein [Mesobacillus maritimus]MCM3585639.1 hemolysin III family protein [Mesobacillus maritimus]
MNQLIREPINGFTHLAGAILSFIGLLAMVIKAASVTTSPKTLTAVILFGLSMILLYSASATYHLVIARESIIHFFRRLDHSMIFVLIAGTYAPFCLITLSGLTGSLLFSVIMALALAGVTFKMVWFECPRWLSTSLYIAMGWLIVFAVVPLTKNLPETGLWLLILGGVLYTVGGVIYATKPKFLELKHMGFHEIFHIFILLGSLAHFCSVYFFVL